MGCLKIDFTKPYLQDYEPIIKSLNKKLTSNKSKKNTQRTYYFGFNKHEKDDEVYGEGNHLAFGGFGLDSRIGRRWNVEPLIKKYPNHSSYLVFANNPILFADPDGNDIIVLSYGQPTREHRWGHQAMLIGDDKNGWNYYSLDGDGIGPRKDDNSYTIKHFDNLQQFANSEHNTFKSEYDDNLGKQTSETDENGNIKQRYTEGFRIETSKEVDAKMNEAAKSTTEKGHFMLGNNCTNNVEAALDAGGLKNGENTLIKTTTVPIPFTDKKVGVEIYERNYMPHTKQAEIERGNKGVDVDNFLVPNE